MDVILYDTYSLSFKNSEQAFISSPRIMIAPGFLICQHGKKGQQSWN